MDAAIVAAQMKEIPNFDGLWADADEGVIWSARRRGSSKRDGIFLRRLSGSLIGKYRMVCVRDNAGKKHSIGVHRLIAMAFLGPLPPGLETCHWDDDGDNNRLDNLRYDTAAGNASDMVRLGTRKGERSPRAVLGNADVRLAQERLIAGDSVMAVAEALNCHPQLVREIIGRRSWTHLQPVPGWDAFLERHGVPEGVELRPIPGFPQYWIGSDKIVYSERCSRGSGRRLMRPMTPKTNPKRPSIKPHVGIRLSTGQRLWRTVDMLFEEIWPELAS